MTNETYRLHPNGGIVLTNLTLLRKPTCGYNGNEIEQNYCVNLNTMYDTLEGMHGFVTPISLRSVDALAEDLIEFDPNDVEDPAVFGDTQRIEYRDGIQAECIICLDSVQGEGIVFDVPSKKTQQRETRRIEQRSKSTNIPQPAIAVHCDCTDECAAALKAVWEYTDEILSDSL